MKQCRIPPYEGDQKYIYIAYSFKDKHLVYPIIEQLTKDGYRVWYDEGILYPDVATANIAEKLAKCEMVLAFLSDNSVDFYNFRREISYSIIKKKNLIAVILEEVQLAPGMEMQISVFPAIYKYKLENNEAFYKRLYSFNMLQPCFGEPDASIVVSDEEQYKENLADWFGVDQRRTPPIEEAELIRARSEEEDTIVPKAVLIKLTTHEEIKVTIPKMIIGRAVTEQSKPIVDYSIETNSMISRFHAVILWKNNEFYLVDCGAVNKTYLNSEELNINQEYLLHDGDIIKLANEKFHFRRLEV